MLGTKLLMGTTCILVLGTTLVLGIILVLGPRPGSVVVERSPGMREVGGSIPGRAKQKTLKFEVLQLCLALNTKELETIWPARSQNNGLGWDITAYPWGGVSLG